MTLFLHRLSGFFFYVLGLSFFGAYVLLRQGIYDQWAAIWLQSADLPFAFCALLYGGLSLYHSLSPERTSKGLAWTIAVPLGIIFAALVALNFWGTF